MEIRKINRAQTTFIDPLTWPLNESKDNPSMKISPFVPRLDGERHYTQIVESSNFQIENNGFKVNFIRKDNESEPFNYIEKGPTTPLSRLSNYDFKSKSNSKNSNFKTTEEISKEHELKSKLTNFETKIDVIPQKENKFMEFAFIPQLPKSDNKPNRVSSLPTSDMKIKPSPFLKQEFNNTRVAVEEGIMVGEFNSTKPKEIEEGYSDNKVKVNGKRISAEDIFDPMNESLKQSLFLEESSIQKKWTKADFVFGKMLGKGAFGSVYQAMFQFFIYSVLKKLVLFVP